MWSCTSRDLRVAWTARTVRTCTDSIRQGCFTTNNNETKHNNNDNDNNSNSNSNSNNNNNTYQMCFVSWGGSGGS